METNSTQGFAVLVFLVAFTFLGAALFTGGKLLFILLFVVGTAFSVALFHKGKPSNYAGDQTVEAHELRGITGEIAITKKEM